MGTYVPILSLSLSLLEVYCKMLLHFCNRQHKVVAVVVVVVVVIVVVVVVVIVVIVVVVV